MMISKGDKIDNRYEIIRSIGEGGMANVYLAYDPCLERNVAVKILRGDLASDEKFVRRFQREAVSASSLTHPNIVEVYDVGEDNGKYFIVMEYVEGKTLKQLIKKRGALTLPEVVDIMLQLTSAIAKAHESYIIHRDIKPQNVIILEDGRVKVMDFGIASQLNNNELTQTNSVMGTVYYLPPEQANGLAVTTRSDIYSLGILMYELVTGKVPFKGDSPVEVAIKQMKEPISDLSEYNPDIPQSVSNVILRACAKNPKNRYESAEAMHDDLKTVLDKDRFSEPKVVYEYSETDFSDDDDMVKGSRASRTKEAEDAKKDKKLNKWVKIFAGIAIFLVAILLFVFLIFPSMTSKKSATVPDVSGMSVSKAEKALEDEGFEVALKTKKETSDTVKSGKVIETDPEAGRTIKTGTKITLIVSKGSKKMVIEDYTGQNYYEVKGKLEAFGIKVSTENQDTADNGDVKENVVLSQDIKAGEKLAKGDEITLVIPKLYTVYPDFTSGYSLLDVKNFASKNGLSLEVSEQAFSSKEDGTIIYQNMAAGTKVNNGDSLKVTVVKNSVNSSSDGDSASE